MTEFTLFGVVLVAVELLGVLTAFHAVMRVRSSQGAIAWVIFLLLFPWLTLPLYWIFGRNKFQGYIKARRVGDTDMHRVVRQVATYAHDHDLLSIDANPEHRVLEELARMPFTCKNNVRLLIDGDAKFKAVFDAIDEAQQYIVVQYFIVRDDEIGREMKQRLVAKAQAGVRIYFLYDEIGCHKLASRYLNDLRDAGVQVRAFHSTKGTRNRFQINFRNHRKIVIIDGRTAFVGGLNVGDEYLGRSKKFGPWRDTHLQIEGPTVHATQLSFLEDWYWATQQVPELDWLPQPAQQRNQAVLVMPTGPADRLETCGMMFIHLINAARHRIWIASPYFVPDQHVIVALQLAALRGVDVRIMLPEKPDHVLVYLSGFTCLEETEPAGVDFYRYQRGFMHHKVVLVDDHLAGVGTANLDNRSFRLNFEITIIVDDGTFAREVEAMLERDFENCCRVTAQDYRDKPLWFRIAARFSRLMAPIQ